MEKSNNHQSSMPATTADLSALKTEIIAAVKDSVQGLATQETVSAVMEAVAETKESVTDLTGLMKDMLEDLTATHEMVVERCQCSSCARSTGERKMIQARLAPCPGTPGRGYLGPWQTDC